MAQATKSVNDRMLAFLQKTEGANTFSVKQGRRLFRVENVSARIAELRQAGHPIYTNMVRNGRGEKTAVYHLGAPTKSERASRTYARQKKSA